MGKIILVCMCCLVCSVLNYTSYAEEDNIELEKIVVTPHRIGGPEGEITSNVTVITQKDIQVSNAQNVSDVLREKTGINVYSNSTAKTVKADIRGFADTSVSNVLVLIDGRKVNSIDMSGPDWLQIPVETIEKIEIIRGAGSVLYGDNAVAGVINIITKKGKGKLSGKAGVMRGSYHAQQEDLEISGSKDKLSYYAYSKYYATEGYRANSSLLTKDINLRLGYDLQESLALDVSTNWHKDDYGMPGGLDDITELEAYTRRGSADSKDFASTKDRYFRLSIDASPYIKENKIGSFITDIFYRNRDAYSWFDYGGWPTATKSMIDTKGVTTKYVYDMGIFDKEFNIVSGIDYYDTEHIIRGSETNTDDLVIFKDELGFYTFSEYEFIDKVFANIGGRYQKAEYRFDQKKPAVLYFTREPSETLFMGGLKHEYAAGSNVYFNIQKTFRFLATDEWYSTWTGLNTNLRQQTGMQYEIGLKHNLDDKLLVSITPYWIDIQDEIYVNPVPSPGQTQNYDNTRRKGIELGFNADLAKFVNIAYLDKFELFENLTYQESKFRGGVYGDKDIPMCPNYLNNTGFNIGFLKNYNVSLSSRYIGERYAINDTKNETAKVKDFFVTDTQVSYKKGIFEGYLSINNIFNKKYSEYAAKSTSSSKKDFYPSPERNFNVGMKYSF